jgi:Enoyl-CoA hydratase/isomerase
LIIPDHASGFPVLRALSLWTCRRHCPGAADGRIRRSKSLIRVSLPRFHYRVGLHIVLFEVCSAFPHVAACTLVTKFVTAIRGLQTFRRLHACPGCFRRERSPGGPCTHWKTPPCHGARRKPVIAAVNGWAAGAGFYILLSSTDIRIASREHARFKFALTSQGWRGHGPGATLLARQLRYIDAMKMLLTAEPVDAEEALEVAPSYALAVPSLALQTTPALLLPASPIDRKGPS